MDTYATTIFVIADEILAISDLKEDPQSRMSNAEVMTFAILAAQYFSGNHKRTRYMCKKLQLFPHILSNSRLNRRIHNIPWVLWQAVFHFLALCFQNNLKENAFAIDSFPVTVCQKSRIDRRRWFHGKQYIGYSASKKKYICGIKVHMVVTSRGEPVELAFTPASTSDINVLWSLELDLPSDSYLYADGAYSSFDLEDLLAEMQNLHLLAKRSKHTKRRLHSKDLSREISSKRQIVETVFSAITDLFPRNIKARTERGFLLKILCFVIAYSTSRCIANILA